MAITLLWLAIWLWLRKLWYRWRHPSPWRRIHTPVAARVARNARKSAWVRYEVIRLKAFSPQLGCRKLADCFNRLHARRGESVSPTWVWAFLRKHPLEVMRMRRVLKHRIPRPMPRNRVWAMDLTGKADLTGTQSMILGLIDHGTRAGLVLKPLADKSSLTILQELCTAFRRFGLPRRIRVDNEACFNSLFIRLCLGLLGIRLQAIDLHCPWQNGRIERFFGTLKKSLDQIAVADIRELSIKLVEFRAWYNHVRPHQHLNGRTPAECWEKRDKSCKPPEWFSIWEGRITGWYFPR